MLSWIWKIYLTSHPTKIDSEYSILTSFRVLSLLTFFSQPSSSMASWASQPASSASHWLSSSVSDFDSASFSSSFLQAVWYMWHIILSVIRKSILHRLKYRDFGCIISLKYDQIGDPKTPFSNFLKYGENKKSHVFTIDNTIVLKKRSQFLLLIKGGFFHERGL